MQTSGCWYGNYLLLFFYLLQAENQLIRYQKSTVEECDDYIKAESFLCKITMFYAVYTYSVLQKIK